MKTLFATLFVSLLSFTSAVAQTSAAAPAAQLTERKDLQVFNDIADQVNRYTQLTIFDSISASVDEGRVVLSGWVTMPFKKDDLERRVRKVDGVMTVDNKIGVLPASQFDDQLRFRIARAIYSHSSFWNYAMNVITTSTPIAANKARVLKRIDSFSILASIASGVPLMRSVSSCSHTMMLPRSMVRDGEL